MLKPELSVVVPLYNEAEVLPLFVRAVSQVLEGVARPWELVLVDDGSRDQTVEVLSKLAADEPRIVSVVLSRNFGKEAALSAGLQVARGRGVVVMDGDLQHPPELIVELVARWDEGAQVVHGVKLDRGDEGLAYRASSLLFNALMTRAVGRSFQRESDFKLLDRVAVDALCALPERVRFFRGLVAWVGFRSADVPFRVAERAAGRTTWGLWGLVLYALRNLVAFTNLPLQLIAAFGALTTVAGGILALQTLWNWFTDRAVDGFTTVILVVLIVGGSNLLSVGALSLYVAAIFEEVKRRPLFLVRAPSDCRGSQ